MVKRYAVVCLVLWALLATGTGRAGHILPTGYAFTDKRMLVSAGEPVDVTGRRIRVFIFLGQSNMVGRARAAEFPEGVIAPDPRVLRLEDDGWVVQRPHKRRNGPEIVFGHEMSRAWPDETIGIIKVALEGTGIRAFVPNWSYDLAECSPGDGRKGPLYRILRRRIELARSLSDVEFQAVFWKQGGSDMRRRRTAEGYVEYLREIIEAIRKDTGTDRLPLFVATYATAEQVHEVARSADYARLLSRAEAAPPRSSPPTTRHRPAYRTRTP